MKNSKLFFLAAFLILGGMSLTAQTKRSDDFRARYELKEVVVMSRHNIRSPLSSSAPFDRITPYEWFKWSSPGSQLSLRGGVLETEMGQLQGRTLLSLDVPPMVMPITIEGLAANADGLYRFADLDAHMAATMAEYEAIEDAPDAVGALLENAKSANGQWYNLQGMRIDAPQREYHWRHKGFREPLTV